MEVVLDGKQIRNQHEFHQVLREKLGLPDYYGDNLDALWDCLTGWVETPLTIVWKDFHVSQKYLGEYASKAADLLKRAESAVPGLYVRILKNA